MKVKIIHNLLIFILAKFFATKKFFEIFCLTVFALIFQFFFGCIVSDFCCSQIAWK